MDTDLSHEAIKRFEAIEARLDAAGIPQVEEATETTDDTEEPE